jgi:hypothetical protein
VLVDLRTNRIYRLNPTASRVWELIQSGSDRSSIERVMLDEFDVEQAHLAGELDRVLSELAERGLVTHA